MALYDDDYDDEMPRDLDDGEIPAEVAEGRGKVVTANDGGRPALFVVASQTYADVRRARESGLL